jgi:hypothetical protein
MNILKRCLNWKVLAGVALAAVGLFVYAPGFALAALPFLVLAICPLSMILMMGAMNNMNGDGDKSGAACATGKSRPASRQEELAQLKAQQHELAARIANMEEDSTEASGSGRLPLIRTT